MPWSTCAPKGVKANATGKRAPRPRRYHLQQERHPFSTRQKPTDHLGHRLGSPAVTSCGFGEPEFRQIATGSAEVSTALPPMVKTATREVEAKVRAEVEALCARFPSIRVL